MHSFTHSSFFPFIHIFYPLSIFLPTHSPIYHYPAIYPSIYHLSFHPPGYLPIHSSIYPSIDRSVYASIHPYAQSLTHLVTHPPTIYPPMHLHTHSSHHPITHPAQIFMHLPTTHPSTQPPYPLSQPFPPIYHLTFWSVSYTQCSVLSCGMVSWAPSLGGSVDTTRGSPQREIGKPARSPLSPFMAWTLPKPLASRVCGQTMMKYRVRMDWGMGFQQSN